MIDEIIKLRRRGLSFRKIAVELDTTVGKVQYQWTKLVQNKAKRSSDEPFQTSSPNQGADKKNAPIIEDKINITRISAEKIKVYWEISIYKENMVAQYFNRPISSWRKALRIYDVTGVIFDGGNAQSDHEVVLLNQHTEWTFKGLKPNRVYCIEMGVKLTENNFFPLLRSDALYTSEMGFENISRPQEPIQEAAEWTESVSTYTYYETLCEGEG
ncbi:DUF4912 domain-containing protein [Bacillus sp. ISL-47]|uniref:DUF4912 domain-containing protein n=1 Tax=Bacillus sp. ISL-47 TaxID=2819130 RepID=UPI001BE6467F|nr:DUF4912 domain-containing protein [Bacillus sp. ISL-47]MBT2687127.1 DUF4912 domain-containing protein [Bacillus sp. ISL-47]MBT2710477.1 DUF4912 domain-containing protein [Pseudomonas sp. ISL-84]